MSHSEQAYSGSAAKVGSESGSAPDSPFGAPPKNAADGAPTSSARPEGVFGGGSAGASGNGSSARPGAPRPGTGAPISSQMSGNPVQPASRPAAPGGSTEQMASVSGRPFTPGAPAAGPGYSGALAQGAPASRPVAPSQQPGVPRPQAGQQTTVQPQQRPASAATVQRAAGPRKVRLNIAKVDPFSVLKLSFLVSVGIGIATVIASIVVWQVLDGMGVFSEINRLAAQIGGQNSTFDVNDYVGLGRVVSLSTVIAVINVALLTALSTLGAFLYNLSSGLVGGLHVTLSDD